jgi:hypothetical protein
VCLVGKESRSAALIDLLRVFAHSKDVLCSILRLPATVPERPAVDLSARYPSKGFRATSFAIVALLALLLLQFDFHFPRRNFDSLAALYASLTLGSAFAYISSAAETLHSPIESVTVLFLLSGLLSLAAFLPLLAVSAFRRLPLPSVSPNFSFIRFAAFPFVWAFSWSIIGHVSPLGRQGDFVPLSSGPFDALVPWFGLPGIDFILAASARACADVGGWWLMRASGRDDTQTDEAIEQDSERVRDVHDSILPPRPLPGAAEPEDSGKSRLTAPRLRASVTFGLVAFVFSLVLPALLTAPRDVALVRVGCVFPPTWSDDVTEQPYRLDDLLHETRVLASQGARLVVWPEAAARFEDERTKKERWTRCAAS